MQLLLRYHSRVISKAKLYKNCTQALASILYNLEHCPISSTTLQSSEIYDDKTKKMGFCQLNYDSLHYLKKNRLWLFSRKFFVCIVIETFSCASRPRDFFY